MLPMARLCPSGCTLADDGAPPLQAHEWTGGSYPYGARFSPRIRILCVCNQRSDPVAIFVLDTATVRPRFAEQYAAVPSPAGAEVMGEAGR
ncbi:beta-propeller fold lactonase family protein [Roseateles sp.]|jgi:hypothetical protein|uniref:beta-propeller fold lactonase family protein n=1 Tax=Roseateles sp. TaxID=1971397 RepID=UPI0037C97DD8